MSKIVLHIITHTFLESLNMLPFLFIAYLLIEYIEHKKSHSIENALAKTGRFGFILGSILGIVPQCGFSVAASNFYAGKVITMGTLVAVFVSTSDEAVPLLLADPQNANLVLKLIAAKIIIALIAGFLTDFVIMHFIKKDAKPLSEHIHGDICTDCSCEKNGILYGAFRHTLSIYLFILIISLVLNAAVEFIGNERLSALLLTDSYFQPVIAAIIGLIPNCASSVVLTELLMSGALSFGSAVSGLCAGAGMGLLVLFKVNRRTKENVCVLVIITLTGIISGLILQALGI